ncbi:uncharacterized protein LOC118819121 [Colossoma macropomum]|uniref:uncharacterized protein LOC118819121 n=1 Tax=Colossoma macropomum TaxID=42526 RepID=UPI001863AC72|nr:uncharacterized protein LOC118819121 [Colossoma macropomum]
MFNVDEALFFKNLTLFYLKLQAKLLLPASVIKTVIEGFEEIHDLGQSHVFAKLTEKLTLLGTDDTTIKNVIKELAKEDLLKTGNRLLRTDQCRKTMFKNSFNYVGPMPLYLGLNESGKECFTQYNPLKETLTSLFESKSVWKQYKNVHSHVTDPDILQDIWDGEVVLQNELFQTKGSSLALILYQDSFEVVNPLGSGKKKHKVLAVYSTLGDIPPHYRSNTDHMQLVLLCKEQDFKHFGQEAVFRQLIIDLKELEDSGIVLKDGRVLRGGLCAIAGDNLGSHNIGGFMENFSKSVYFCRFCDIDRETFVTSIVNWYNKNCPVLSTESTG